jgi:ribonuclease BN (tRNA processing enzyme)
VDDMKSAMEITTIGTGACVPRLERGSSCLFCEAGGKRIFVDVGLGALHGLLKCGVSHGEIDAVLLTHLHLDHTCELMPLLFAANYDETPRTRPLTLIGREGTREFLEKLGGVYGHWIEPQHFELTVVELAPGDETSLGEVKVAGGGVAHGDSSLAYRIVSGDKCLVVSGDTGPSAEFEAFARGADLLVCEAALAGGVEAPYHLNAEQAGEVAERAGVGQLVLTHFYPSSDQTDAYDPAACAAEAFDGAIKVAHDGMKVTLDG